MNSYRVIFVVVFVVGIGSLTSHAQKKISAVPYVGVNAGCVKLGSGGQYGMPMQMTVPGAVFGASLKFDLSPKWQLRLDANTSNFNADLYSSVFYGYQNTYFNSVRAKATSVQQALYLGIPLNHTFFKNWTLLLGVTANEIKHSSATGSYATYDNTSYFDTSGVYHFQVDDQLREINESNNENFTTFQWGGSVALERTVQLKSGKSWQVQWRIDEQKSPFKGYTHDKGDVWINSKLLIAYTF